MAKKAVRKETFTRWDAADHLKSDKDVAAYFEACMEEAGDDPAFIAAALGDMSRPCAQVSDRKRADASLRCAIHPAGAGCEANTAQADETCHVRWR